MPYSSNSPHQTWRIFKKALHPSELPKSFRDATAIAQKFRVKYLWIDSLCIIQDSVVDWRQEAAYMGDIYRNSFCNISATGASNSELGCFAERDPSMVLPCRIISAWTNTTNQMYHVVASRFWDHVVEAPLNRRSWVVLERLLAPRVLHYGRDQLFWECHELEACERFPRGLPPGLSETGFKGMDPQTDGKRLQTQANEDKIVRAYTCSDLTKIDDKLIALSESLRL